MRLSLRTFLLVVAATATLFGVVDNLTSGHTWFDWYRLARRGQQTEGVVTRLDPANHQTGHFSYSVDGVRYTGSDQGLEKAVGEQVTILYLPEDPAFATTAKPWGVLGWRLFGVTFLSFFAGLAALDYMRRHKGPR